MGLTHFSHVFLVPCWSHSTDAQNCVINQIDLDIGLLWKGQCCGKATPGEEIKSVFDSKHVQTWFSGLSFQRSRDQKVLIIVSWINMNSAVDVRESSVGFSDDDHLFFDNFAVVVIVVVLGYFLGAGVFAERGVAYSPWRGWGGGGGRAAVIADMAAAAAAAWFSMESRLSLLPVVRHLRKGGNGENV